MFLRFLAKSAYEYAWLIEEDVEHVSNWSHTLDAYRNVKSDIISLSSNGKHVMKHVRTGPVKMKNCLYNGSRCLTKKYLKASYMQMVRISKEFAQKIISSIDTGILKGHHEYSVAEFCKQINCVHTVLKKCHVSFFRSGHTFADARVRLREEKKLVHPSKCKFNWPISTL